MQKCAMQIYDREKLNYVAVKEQYIFKILNQPADLKNMHHNMNITRPWENIIVNIKISAKESLGHY
jgi:hypothetical protein